jgi:hypothetical protein
MVNVRRLIDDIAEPLPRPDRDEQRSLDPENCGLSTSPFSSPVININLAQYQQQTHDQSMTSIHQTHHGSGHMIAAETATGNTLSGNNTVHNAPQTPEAAQQEIQELLKQLRINAQTTEDKLKNQVMIQDLTWQQTLWAAFKNAGPELAKNAVSIALTSAGLPGAIAAAAFNVVVEGVRGGLEARKALPPGENNPFGEWAG